MIDFNLSIIEYKVAYGGRKVDLASYKYFTRR